jgi:hypothetical protein
MDEVLFLRKVKDEGKERRESRSRVTGQAFSLASCYEDEGLPRSCRFSYQ